MDYARCTFRYVRQHFNGQGKIIEEFLADKEMEGIGEQTLYKYAKDMRFWVDNLPRRLDECAREDIRQGMIKLYETPLAPGTKEKRKISLKVFYRWLKKCERPEETGWRWAGRTASSAHGSGGCRGAGWPRPILCPRGWT